MSIRYKKYMQIAKKWVLKAISKYLGVDAIYT